MTAYKSAVIVSRNDNYGGNLPQRAVLCLNAMCRVFDEVVYVDWNSPERSLMEDIRPGLNKTGKLKHIVVPSDLAKQLVPDPQAQDCVEVIGRNIGLRRARGDFLVSTNIDIIPTDFDTSKLPFNHFWVAARRDVPKWFEEYTSDFGADLLPELRKAFFPRHPDAVDGHSLVNCCGDFQIAHRNVWHAIRGFEESMIYRAFADTNVMIKARKAGFNVEKLDYDFYHLNHYDAAYHRMHQVKPLNDKEKFVTNFQGTTNSESWGYTHLNLSTELL